MNTFSFIFKADLPSSLSIRQDSSCKVTRYRIRPIAHLIVMALPNAEAQCPTA
jgi:hypothetical protein